MVYIPQLQPLEVEIVFNVTILGISRGRMREIVDGIFAIFVGKEAS
jgi:uncharacterized membrane protein